MPSGALYPMPGIQGTAPLRGLTPDTVSVRIDPGRHSEMPHSILDATQAPGGALALLSELFHRLNRRIVEYE